MVLHHPTLLPPQPPDGHRLPSPICPRCHTSLFLPLLLLPLLLLLLTSPFTPTQYPPRLQTAAHLSTNGTTAPSPSASSTWLSPALRNFNPATDFRSPVIRRYGITNCPDNLAFETDGKSPSLSAPQVVVNGVPCSNGSLHLREARVGDLKIGPLSTFLLGERAAGRVFVATVESRELVCEDARFDDRAMFTFVRPVGNVSVDWEVVFGWNETRLAVAMGGGDSGRFVMQEGVSYVVVNSVCLYSEFTKEEFDVQRGEACFPAGASVRVRDKGGGWGELPMERLRIGDVVEDGGDGASVIGWTHWDASIERVFVRLVLDDGGELVLSEGHYVYVYDGGEGWRRRRGWSWERRRTVTGDAVEEGDWVMLAGEGKGRGRLSRVVGVDTVWRRGLFNVQTTSGDVVVNGVVCSTYTRAVGAWVGAHGHEAGVAMGHAMLTPVRAVAFFGGELLRWLPLPIVDERCGGGAAGNEGR